MICGFGITLGTPSRTYSDASYQDEIPAELREIGEMMALEDYCANGPMRRGYDHVRVELDPFNSDKMLRESGILSYSF